MEKGERRIVCAWFPHWPMEAWRREKAREEAGRTSFVPDSQTREAEDEETLCDAPFALLAPTPRGDVIHGLDPLAASLGLTVGQRATDAMAAIPDLRADYANPEHEARALSRLSGWARRWSPLVRVDGCDGIAMDATGCTHLFGGEPAMLADVRDRLATLGVTARLAMAPNHAAAHALSRHVATQDEPAIVEGSSLKTALAPLPVAALRIMPSSVTLLRRLGLKTIGALTAIPRSALKKRFQAKRRMRDPRDDTYDDYLGRKLDRSGDVLVRLDEALGLVVMPLDPTMPVPQPRIVQGLPEPVLDVPVALEMARPLVAELSRRLERRGEGMRGVALEAFRVDGGRARAVLRLTRPVRDADHIMRLFVERTNEWRAEFGVDALAVEALVVEPMGSDQSDGLEARVKVDPHALIDRLRARLGDGAVLRPVLHDSHWPERAETWMPVRDWKAEKPTPTISFPSRPDRLFDPPHEIRVIHAVPHGPPARFSWHRRVHDVVRVAGPERIAPEWWRERFCVRARDYYRIETGEGRRLWLFREGFEEDEREAPPRWFLHGAFA